MGEENTKVPTLTLKEREENLKEALRNGGFIGDNGTWNSIIMFSGDKHVYRHRVETLIIKDLSEVYLRFDDKGKYHIPAGSTEKDLPFITQAENECNEEALVKVRNLEHTGITYKVVVPIPKTVKPTDNHGIQWSGNYNELFIGEYDGVYRKAVDEVDKDSFMAKGKFYPIHEVMNKLIPEHKEAIVNYMRMRNSSEFNEKADYDKYYSCKRMNFFGDIFEFTSYSSFLENFSDIDTSSTVFYRSIDEAILEYSDKDIGSYILVSEAAESLSGKILNINKTTGEVNTSVPINTNIVKMVKMIDGRNYSDVTPSDDDNLITLYHPTPDDTNTDYNFNHQLFWSNYDDAYNQAIYLAIKKELPKISKTYRQVFPNSIRWNSDLNKIECSKTVLELLKRYLVHSCVRSHVYTMKVNNSDLIDGEIKNYNTDCNCVLFSFIINPEVLESAVHIMENPFDAVSQSTEKKFCISNDPNYPIPVYTKMEDAIRDYVKKYPDASPDRPISIASSDFFANKFFNSPEELDGCPVKLITKPLGVWCNQLRLKEKQTLMESTSKDANVNYKRTIDLEAMVVITYLNQNFKYFTDLFTYFEDIFKSFKHNNDPKFEGESIQKIDKIMKSIEDEIENGYSLYISSSNRIINTYKSNPKAYEFSRLNFNTIYKKYHDLFNKYEKLMDKIDDETASVLDLNLDMGDAHVSKTKFNRLIYRFSDAYRIIGKIYLKLDDIMNPGGKVDKE